MGGHLGDTETLERPYRPATWPQSLRAQVLRETILAGVRMAEGEAAEEPMISSRETIPEGETLDENATAGAREVCWADVYQPATRNRVRCDRTAVRAGLCANCYPLIVGRPLPQEDGDV